MTARDITCIVSLEVKRARASTQPWQTYLPGTYELYCSKFFLKLVFIKTNSINMEITPEVMRTETPVAVAKGFLELSEETMCMLPFKAHPKGLAAYEERLILTTLRYFFHFLKTRFLKRTNCNVFVPSHSLERMGSTEHHKFCECFEIVVNDTSLTVPQKDPLNIIEPWKKMCMIDEDLLVSFAVHTQIKAFCKL